MSRLVSNPEILGELSIKVNDILLYGDTEIRELIPDLIREFHNQLMSDPKTLVALKSHSHSPPDRIGVHQPFPSKDGAPQILHPMGKRFTQRTQTLKEKRKDNQSLTLPQKTNPQEHFESSNFPEKRFMDTLPELIGFIDRDLKYKFNNASYEKWFGSKVESLCDTKVSDLLGSHFKKLKPFFEQTLDGEIVEISSPVYFKGTQGRMIQSSYFPYYGENDKVEGFFAVVKGVTNKSDSEKAKIQFLKPPFKKP
jgi:PAS domain S-box-containing protein